MSKIVMLVSAFVMMGLAQVSQAEVSAQSCEQLALQAQDAAGVCAQGQAAKIVETGIGQDENAAPVCKVSVSCETEEAKVTEAGWGRRGWHNRGHYNHYYNYGQYYYYNYYYSYPYYYNRPYYRGCVQIWTWTYGGYGYYRTQCY